MKRNAIVRIVVFSLLTVILIGILAVGLLADHFAFRDGNWGVSEIGGTVSSVGAVDAGTVSEIHIDWASGNIRIQPGDTDTISFEESEVSKENHRMVWKHSGSKLTLQFSKDGVFSTGFGTNITISKDLVITVPKNWICSELSFDVASADVEIVDLTITDVDFDGASGKCEFLNCTVDELSVDTASGNIHFSGTLNEMDCDAASADCKIEVSNVPSRIDLDSASGDLELTLPENAGFRLNLSTLSGDFNSEFPTTMSGGNYVCGDGKCRIEMDAMSGKVTIRKAQAANSTF